MSTNGISVEAIDVVVTVSSVAFVVVAVVAVVISMVSYSMEDSKNFGTLKSTEKTKTGMRYLATRCFMALALFRFWKVKNPLLYGRSNGSVKFYCTSPGCV